MVRFGIIGVGHTVAIAKQHVEALKKLPEVQITALLSRTKTRAEDFSKVHCPSATVCETLEDLLNLVDCVCICSPNHTHAAYAAAALRAGKGVLCEKPLGGTPEELSTLRHLSLTCGTPNMVAYNFRYQAPVQRLHALLHSGELGSILWYQEQKGGNRLADPSIPYEWRMDRRSGGGSTMDFCSHMLDHYLYLSGEPIQSLGLAHAQFRTFVPQRPDGAGGMRTVETEDFSHLCFTGSSGASIVLTASRVGIPCERIEVVCTGGMALYTSLQPEQLLVWRKNADGVLPTSPERLSCPGTLQETYDAQDRAFLDAYLGNRSIHPTLAEGCDLLALLKHTLDTCTKTNTSTTIGEGI